MLSSLFTLFFSVATAASVILLAAYETHGPATVARWLAPDRLITLIVRN